MNITKSFISYMHKSNENVECATLQEMFAYNGNASRGHFLKKN